jgi:hypothetical protein
MVAPLFHLECLAPRGTSSASPARSTCVSPSSFTLSSPLAISKRSSWRGWK